VCVGWCPFGIGLGVLGGRWVSTHNTVFQIRTPAPQFGDDPPPPSIPHTRYPALADQRPAPLDSAVYRSLHTATNIPLIKCSAQPNPPENQRNQGRAYPHAARVTIAANPTPLFHSSRVRGVRSRTTATARARRSTGSAVGTRRFANLWRRGLMWANLRSMVLPKKRLDRQL